jgi:hypothetical protein
VLPPWKLRAASSVVEAECPVFVKPAPARVVDVGTGQLSKCWSCFQKPGVHPWPGGGVVVVGGGVVDVVGDVVVVVSVVDDELDELGVSVANPTPVMTVANAKPPSARTRTASSFAPLLLGLRMHTPPVLSVVSEGPGASWKVGRTSGHAY